MADIYFGAAVPVVAHNGNWNDVNQWYSSPGNQDYKSGDTPGTPLARLPLMTDVCILVQYVTTGVVARVLTLTGSSSGIWTGNLNVAAQFGAWNQAGVDDPGATWSGTGITPAYFNVGSGIVNLNFTNSAAISGGTLNGTVTNCSNITGGTFNSSVSGQITVNGNPVFNGPLTLIALTLQSGTFTKAITSWATSGQGRISIGGGTYNSPSSPTSNLSQFSISGGTMAQNIFTSAYAVLNTVSIHGGTLSFTGNIQIGAPGRASTVRVNTLFASPQFAGTDKNITIYANITNSTTGTQWGNIPNSASAGVYTGVITILSSTGLGNVINTINGGTYTPPVQIFPITNVAYGTGKGVAAADALTFHKNWGFATFNHRVAISGSSDILQSGLA